MTRSKPFHRVELSDVHLSLPLSMTARAVHARQEELPEGTFTESAPPMESKLISAVNAARRRPFHTGLATKAPEFVSATRLRYSSPKNRALTSISVNRSFHFDASYEPQ